MQKDAVEFIVEHAVAALFFQQRLGKTWIALGAIEKLEPDFTLLIVPLANKQTTWSKLIREKLRGYKFTDDLAAFIAWRKAGLTKLILLVHFEQMVSIIKKLRKQPWSIIFIDEAHRLKDRASKQSRTAAQLKDCCERKVILTGTPIERRPQDVWAQFRFLLPEAFGTRWANFEDEYIEPPPFDLDEVREDGKLRFPRGSMRWRRAMFKNAITRRKRKFKPEKVPKFLRIIGPHSWREELPSPEPNFIHEQVTLLGYQRRVYDEMDRDQFVYLKDGTRILAELEITKREKLHQICGGWLIDEDKEVHAVGRAKLRRTKAIIARNGYPAVVFCKYRHEIEALRQELPGRVGVLRGERDKRKRDEAQRAFQSGKLDIIICQTRAGGVGIDLFRAKYLIIFSTTHSYIDFEQLVARIRLPEQKDPVTIFFITASGTIDEDKREMLFAKDHEVRGVLSQLKKRKTP